MKKTLFIIIILVVIAGGIWAWFSFLKNPQSTLPNNTPGSLPTASTSPSSAGTTTAALSVPSAMTSGGITTTTSNPVLPTSSLPDYAGTANEIVPNLSTGQTFQIGTAQGTVTVNNFYLENPPVSQDGQVILNLTENYTITYNLLNSSFGITVTGSPFSAWRSVAETDFLRILGIGQGDACKLSVTEVIPYAPGDSNSGRSFPLGFCSASTFAP